MDVKFLPSFLYTHLYAGKGTLQLSENGLTINGRRIWETPKRMVGCLPVLGILLFVNPVGLLILGPVLIWGWAQACRTRSTDNISYAHISSVKVLKRNRAQFVLARPDANQPKLIVFEGLDVAKFVEELDRAIGKLPEHVDDSSASTSKVEESLVTPGKQKCPACGHINDELFSFCQECRERMS